MPLLLLAGSAMMSSDRGIMFLLQALGLVDRILREQADDIVDTDKAVRRVEAERHRQLASSRDEVHTASCIQATSKQQASLCCSQLNPFLKLYCGCCGVLKCMCLLQESGRHMYVSWRVGVHAQGDDDADDDNKQGHGKAKKGWGKGGKQKSTKGQRFAALKRGEKGQDRKGGVSKVKGGRGAGGKGRGGKGKTGTKR